MRHSWFVALLLAAPVCALSPSPAEAQSRPLETRPRMEARPAFEYFVARNRLELGGGAAELDGVGGRLLWPVAGVSAAPLFSRTDLGGYLVHSPADGAEPEMWHYGVQADLRLGRAPLARRIDPLLSLGVGAVRVEEPATEALRVPMRYPVAVTQTRTDPSVVPGLGARLRLLPGLGLRGDVRMVVDFRERTTRNVETSAGVSVAM
ncbi:MAG TPA: hypothetical protein VGR37_23390 [Longimicrobiaceae bacterium]|nr:hypothetical protein [Longimicrobiaceae bacterium]